mmetsp:Transcript_26441/g.60242  ORF Transcript_26441/g.60242 Transcript_26441/m.60242 type:complete len:233 (+) Transcript_26441:484-1182(+)
MPCSRWPWVVHPPMTSPSCLVQSFPTCTSGPMAPSPLPSETARPCSSGKSVGSSAARLTWPSSPSPLGAAASTACPRSTATSRVRLTWPTMRLWFSTASGGTVWLRVPTGTPWKFSTWGKARNFRGVRPRALRLMSSVLGVLQLLSVRPTRELPIFPPAARPTVWTTAGGPASSPATAPNVFMASTISSAPGSPTTPPPRSATCIQLVPRAPQRRARRGTRCLAPRAARRRW